MKCTGTERGRMINLKQANYKPLKLSGVARVMPASETGVSGTVFIGLASHVMMREINIEEAGGAVVSRHSVDMKFSEVSAWFTAVAGYDQHKLTGVSLFQLVHAADAESVLNAFKNCKLMIVLGNILSNILEYELEYEFEYACRTGVET